LDFIHHPVCHAKIKNVSGQDHPPISRQKSMG